MNDKLLKTAISFIGKDASPANLAPNDLACAESWSDVLLVATGFKYISGVALPILDTLTLYYALLKDSRFVQVYSPQPGATIIYPTENGKHGHVGIMDDDNYTVLSNDSFVSPAGPAGTFDRHLTIVTFRALFNGQAFFFILVEPKPVEQVVTAQDSAQVAEIKTEINQTWIELLMAQITSLKLAIANLLSGKK